MITETRQEQPLAPPGTSAFVSAFLDILAADEAGAPKLTNKQAIFLRRAECSTREGIAKIASDLGCKPATVWSHAKAFGFELPKRPAPKLPHVALTILRLRSGEKPAALALEYGVSQTAIYRQVEYFGFKYAIGIVMHNFGSGRGTLSSRAARVEAIEARVDYLRKHWRKAA